MTAQTDPYQLLRNKADRPVTLTLSRAAKGDSGRQVTFEPVSDESDLIYLEMVQQNRKRVDDATGGRVAYIHVPDMGEDGIREFIKWYYPQIHRQGLIIDDRDNGGGNVSQMLIERLRRTLLSLDFSRTDDAASTYPDGVFVGPKVGLVNENSASDGDIFAAMFKQAKIGPLIGKRSWGGVVGISGHGPLIDGGTVFVPEFAHRQHDRRVDHRRLWRGSGHRGGERSRLGPGGSGSAARAGDRRGQEGAGDPIRARCLASRRTGSRRSSFPVGRPQSCSQTRDSWILLACG